MMLIIDNTFCNYWYISGDGNCVCFTKGYAKFKEYMQGTKIVFTKN
jgi:hypothetical protein